MLGLVGLANHDNVGGIFRNAAAFGADAVLLDDDLLRSALPQGDPRVGRRRAGGSLHQKPDRSDMVSDLHGAGFELFALSPAGRETLEAVKPSTRTALLLGAEGPGLPAPICLPAPARFPIPMSGGFDTLNVATTSGIALHHLCHGHRTAIASPFREGQALASRPPATSVLNVIRETIA